jgi:formylglycine-generating enzyme required for sulfatase activity
MPYGSYSDLAKEINTLNDIKVRTDAQNKRLLDILEAVHEQYPKSDAVLYNLAVRNENLGNLNKAAYWSDKLFALLETEGVVRCGQGKTRSSILTAKYFWKSGEIDKARAFAERADKLAKEIGDDEPDCSVNKFTHDDVWVRTEAANLLDRMNSIPLKPNTITVMTSGPTKKKYINSIAQEFIYIPSGSFTMGDDATPETKRHNVNLTKGYYLQKTEVTQEQWQKVMGSTPSHHKGKNNPVTNVNIGEVKSFILKLNEKEKTLFYRLPTEAEWEYAARSGGKKEKYAGSDIVDTVAWYDSNSDKTTHKVGAKQPNVLGLHDMSGNVYEWCQDWFGDGYYGRSAKADPQGPASGEQRVLRGGDWFNVSGNARTNRRGSYYPSIRGTNYGFRLVLPQK